MDVGIGGSAVFPYNVKVVIEMERYLVYSASGSLYRYEMLYAIIRKSAMLRGASCEAFAVKFTVGDGHCITEMEWRC